MNKPDHWFAAAITAGLQQLLALRLDNTPAVDTIKQTRDVWVKSLWVSRTWEQAPDEHRLHNAFDKMTSDITRWPSPRQLLDTLPPKVKPAAAAPVKSALTREQKRANIERLKAQLNGTNVVQK